MKNNLVFISNNPFPYGMAATNRIKLFAIYMAKNNEVSKLVCGRNNLSNRDSGVYKNVKWSFLYFSRIDYLINLPKTYKIVSNSRKKNHNNILLLYDGISIMNFWFAVFAKCMGYKILTDIVEDYSYINEKQSFFLNISQKLNVFFNRFISFFADGILVISERLKNKLLQNGIPQKKICLIPVSAYNLDRKIKKKKNNKFTFVYAGSFGQKDGIEYMISAFQMLNKKNLDCQLFLSGKINDSTKNLISNKKNIFYKGLIPHKDFYDFLANADVLLMTREKSEYANHGFPFKLGEYLATGNVVITTNVSDIDKYLTDNQNALIASPSDSRSLFQKMNFAINLDKRTLKNIGLNGKKVCEKYFNPDINGKKLETFIKLIKCVE